MPKDETVTGSKPPGENPSHEPRVPEEEGDPVTAKIPRDKIDALLEKERQGEDDSDEEKKPSTDVPAQVDEPDAGQADEPKKAQTPPK